MSPCASLLAGLLAAVPAWAATPYAYDGPGDRRHMTSTAVLERNGPDNRSEKLALPRTQVTAMFVGQPIAVDAVREPAWDAAPVHPIGNWFDADMIAPAPDAPVRGTLRALWDGPVLYLLVEVQGDATGSDTAVPAWSRPAYAAESDGLFVFLDVFNDQWGIETDTQGVFFLGANPRLDAVTSYVNPGIPSLGSFFNPRHQDHAPRLRAFSASGYRAGAVNYTYELALQIEGWGGAWDRPITNGTRIGVEVAIADAGHSLGFLSRTRVDAGREGGSNLPNSERVRNRDWAEVTLQGWDGRAPFAFSSWPAEQNIRFWHSHANPGGGDASRVWTPASKARFVAARDAFLGLHADAARDRREAAVREVGEAFLALRWADQRFPDPRELPVLHTLPDVWRFFDAGKGTGGRVTHRGEWALRRQELLELAEFYEYGTKPRAGTDFAIELTTNDYAGGDSAVVGARVMPTNARYAGGQPVELSLAVELPKKTPGGRPAPIAFGGNWLDMGIARAAFPNWAADSRSDAGAWGNPNRSGIFYRLFPYERNSTVADSGILIANATAVTILLDLLQAAVDANPALRARLDPARAVTKGFSIGGKNAFVAALYDERVKVTIAGGAGATRPASWRFNAQGQEYDFSETPFDAPGAERMVAHGTEGPGNSYRHNRIRKTELFRHFMPYGHMYRHESGAFAYGGYSRLPFDQALLVATLAPDRAILIDTNLNDFNDGAVTDNLSLQIARSVYAALGADPDAFVRFNTGAYRSAGDPHGAAAAGIEGRYLSDFFFGTRLLSDAERQQLNTDPWSLPVSGGRRMNPYDYYWGGFNTITGGQDGIDGTDGWYFHRLTP